MKGRVKMKRNRWILILVVMVLILSACGGKQKDEKGGGGSIDADGNITLDFWYALGGDSGKAVEELVRRFNESASERLKLSALIKGITRPPWQRCTVPLLATRCPTLPNWVLLRYWVAAVQ